MIYGTAALCGVLYLFSWWHLYRQIAREGVGDGVIPAHSAAQAGALIAHAVLIYLVTYTPSGLNLGVANVGSIVGWVVGAMVMITAFSHPVQSLGLLIFPIAAALATVSASSYGMLPETRGVTSTLGVQVHALTSILAYSVLSIAALQSAVLYDQERRLRQRRPGRMNRLLPPLQTQEAMLVQMVGLGFFLLSLSLITGIVFVANIFAQHLVHKTALSAFSWLIFGIVLFGRWKYGWRGRTLVRWNLAGFGILLLAYFGTKLVLEVILDRVWTAA